MHRAAPISSCLLLLASLAGCPGDDGDDGASGVTAATVASDDAGTSPNATEPATATTDAGDASTDEPGPGTSDDGNTATDTGAPATGDETAGESTGAMQMPPPTDGAALLSWLEAGEYLQWTTESAVHDSAGPHFGDVRTYVNDVLLDSLTTGARMHPVDAAAVKELYGTGATPLGWSVIVKVADGRGGDTWYFYEYYDGTTYGDGVGDGSCTGCHSMGSVDYFKSPFPLQ